MNASFYVFGKFKGGYSQYPDDFISSQIFDTFQKNAKAASQLCIHRDGNLIYYGYIRNLEQDSYIGLCIAINSIMLTRVQKIFAIFENTISDMVTKGQLIHYNAQGDIVTSVDKLYMNSEDIDDLAESLRTDLDKEERFTKPLPPVSYGTSKDSVQKFIVTDDKNEIIQSSHTNGYTLVFKEEGFDTARMNSYRGVLAQISKESQELATQLEALKKEHAQTLRKKKQVKVVLALFVIICICGLGLLGLRNTLEKANTSLSIAQDDINDLRLTISNQQNDIKDLKKRNDALIMQYDEENTKRLKAEAELDKFKAEIESLQPFIITKTNFDFQTGQLRIDYHGFTQRSVPILIRVFGDDGEHLQTSVNIDIAQGDNSTLVFVNSSLNSEKYYSFSIFQGNTIIGGGRH
mgnify:CR=1 FL=1